MVRTPYVVGVHTTKTMRHIWNARKNSVKSMTIKRTLTLRLTFTCLDESHGARKIRALLKYLLRAWGIKCESVEWHDQ